MVACICVLLAGCPAGPAADGKEPVDTSADTAGTDSGHSTDTGLDTAHDTGGDTAPDPATLDQDGDGFTPLDGDCDDELPHVYPGAPDYCDGLDQDCDGEPIPDGSCSKLGYGRAMWSWLLEADDDTEGAVAGPAGDQDGDGLGELQLSVRELPAPDQSAHRMGSLFGSDWAGRPAIAPFPDRGFTDSGSRYINPHQYFAGDLDDDGMNEMVVQTDDSEYGDGAVLLYYGRAGGWPSGGGVLEEEADAYWIGAGEPLGLAVQRAGDFNGDGFSDVITTTHLQAADEGAMAVLFGSATRESGAHMLGSLPMAFHEGIEGHSYAYAPDIVPDLDGDGADELSFVFWRAEDEVAFQAFVSGTDVVEGARLLSNLSLLRFEDGSTVNPLNHHPHDAGDWNGDGYNDLAAIPRPEGDELVCASLLSGGIPEGVVEGQAFGQICDLEWAEVMSGWVPDMDDDGEPELLADWNCVVASHRVVIGGTVLLNEVGAPCFSVDGDGRGLTYAVSNLTGGDSAEFAILMLYPDEERAKGTSIGIIAGFDIPWDDPSKW